MLFRSIREDYTEEPSSEGGHSPNQFLPSAYVLNEIKMLDSQLQDKMAYLLSSAEYILYTTMVL